MEPVEENPLSPAPRVVLTRETTGGFGVRALGRLIDMLAGMALGCVSGVFAGIVLAVLTAVGHTSPGWETRMQGSAFANLAAGMVATLAMHTLSEGIGGTSLGKLALGYRVVTTRLEPCTLRGALTRSLGYFVDALFFAIPAYTAMKDSPLNQRYGDQWARTIVAKSAVLPPSAKRPGGLVALGLLGGLLAHALVNALPVILRAS